MIDVPSVGERRVAVDSRAGFTFVRRRLLPALAPYVRDIQGFAETHGAPTLRNELPMPALPLIVVFGQGFTAHDAHTGERMRALDRSFFAGLHQAPALIGSSGSSSCLQADFTLSGARRFFGIDLSDATGLVVDLQDVIGRGVRELEQRLEAENDWAVRFDLFEAFLCRRILGADESPALVRGALDMIEAQRGQLRMSALAGTLGCSRKHLATLFRREVGAGPKTVARLARFEHAQAQLTRRDVPLTDIALELGYADQAHFSREFAAFAGQSPSEFRADLPAD